MQLNDTIIRAACATYTKAQCETKRAEALAALEKGSTIVSVNTGGGPSYTRQVDMKPAEAVEYWQRCIDWHELHDGETGATPAGGRVNVAFLGNETC
ncbi:MAG: hypothetical protein Q3986_06845 [Akkermansia sp.]|nr:hypothetical protein [Akkermansia sp.]